MKWLEEVAKALNGADPVLILAVVVLAFAFLLHSLAIRALAALERVARLRNKT